MALPCEEGQGAGEADSHNPPIIAGLAGGSIAPPLYCLFATKALGLDAHPPYFIAFRIRLHALPLLRRR